MSASEHKYWRLNESDCPPEIKGRNGELHTLRCKVCGEDDPINERCRDAAVGLLPDDVTVMVEVLGERLYALSDHLVRAKFLNPKGGKGTDAYEAVVQTFVALLERVRT